MHSNRESQKNRNREDFKTRTPEGEESRTRQSFAEDADINRIMGKWRKTGFIENVTLHTPVYGDFSTGADYLEAKNALKTAQEVFDALPARVRARVHNNPAELIGFVMNPNNAEELRDLGLANAVDPEPAPEKNPPEAAEQEGGNDPEQGANS